MLRPCAVMDAAILKSQSSLPNIRPDDESHRNIRLDVSAGVFLYCHCCNASCFIVTALLLRSKPMERIKLDYEPLRAATARCDRAHIEAQAQKFGARNMTNVV